MTDHEPGGTVASARPRPVTVGLFAALVTGGLWILGSAALLLVAARSGDPVALALGVVALVPAVGSFVLALARRRHRRGSWLPSAVLSWSAVLFGLLLMVPAVLKLGHGYGMDPVIVAGLAVAGLAGFGCVLAGATAGALLSAAPSRHWFGSGPAA